MRKNRRFLLISTCFLMRMIITLPISRKHKQDRLDQIINGPYFADSKHVGLVQMAVVKGSNLPLTLFNFFSIDKGLSFLPRKAEYKVG